MARETITTLSDLALIDRGTLDRAFARAIEEVRGDLIDRKGLPTTRKIVLECFFTPVTGPDGKLAEVQSCFEVKVKIPGRRTLDYSLGVTVDGFRYNPASPDDHRQGTLDEIEKKGTGR